MAGDVAGYLREVSIDDPRFAEAFARQVYVRNLSEAAIINVGPDRQIRTQAVVNPYDRPFERIVTPKAIAETQAASRAYRSIRRTGWGRLPRSMSAKGITFIRRGCSIPNSASRSAAPTKCSATIALCSRGRVPTSCGSMARCLAGALVIVGLSIFIALEIADRLVRPVGQLVTAAGRVEEGDFSTRVPVTSTGDEIGTLATAFNRMTGRLQEQTGALMAANSQLDTRRAFIEAVLSSVTAGVIALDENKRILLINRSAEALLQQGEERVEGAALAEPVGRPRRIHVGRPARSRRAGAGRLRPAHAGGAAGALSGWQRADVRRHHRPVERPAPRRLVRHRAAHRA